MHATEREQTIVELMRERGFISFKELDAQLAASPATLRRDLERLEATGLIARVRGGARLADAASMSKRASGPPAHLTGVPFHENISLHAAQKRAIGLAAAKLCNPGESIIIDGGSTTLQMCPPLAPLSLNVLTNSLHIVSALLPQPNTRVSLPAGTLFREQDIVLSPFEDDGMDRYRASKMFMGAAAIGRHGILQSDVLLIQAERRLLERADEVVLLVDSSKFHAPAGHVLCDLNEIDTLITDAGLDARDEDIIKAAGITLIIAE